MLEEVRLTTNGMIPGKRDVQFRVSGPLKATIREGLGKDVDGRWQSIDQIGTPKAPDVTSRGQTGSTVLGSGPWVASPK